VATSIDALAVGVSMSLGQVGQDPMAVDHALMINTMIADHVAVFIVTMLSVFAGMFGGYRVGRHFGRPAEIVGGIVLIGIGIGILFGLF
jgi:putative Mn2+ efflux pump MntP